MQPGAAVGNIYVVSTQSNSGKTLIAAALLRLSRARAAPFKAQNMSLNSYPAYNGGEVALAQAMQAYAAGTLPLTYMNPILLKPMDEYRSEVIVLGRPIGAMEYSQYSKDMLSRWRVVKGSMDKLSEVYDVIVGEGAGSAYEPNITGDIANFRPADYLNAGVYVVVDISRGGAFTSALGLYQSLIPRWRRLIRGFIINRFRGDRRLLEDAFKWLRDKTGVDVVGVVPDVPEAARFIWPEDSEAMGDFGSGRLDVAIVAYPGISNFHEFNILALEDVHVRFVRWGDSLGEPDLIILPGAKNTLRAVEWLRSTGLYESLRRAAGSIPILAICGGFQLLGRILSDPTGVEFGSPGHIHGLGILGIDVTYMADKIVSHSLAKPIIDIGFEGPIKGYEIRRGRIIYSGAKPAFTILERNGQPVMEPDGYFNEESRILGLSIHDSLSNPELRSVVIKMAGGVPRSSLDSIQMLINNIDEFSRIVKENVYIPGFT